MSKRAQEFQGGEERYGMGDGPMGGDTSDAPKQATAAQMARRKIAQARKPSGSQRSSRAGTPTGNAFNPQPGQQSMPSFQPPADQSVTGFGSNFNFAVNAPSNPFSQMNGAASTPAPATGFQFGAQPQQNGGSGVFGNSGANFGSAFGGPTQAQQNGFRSSNIFGASQPAATHNTNHATLIPFLGNADSAQPNGFTPSTATTSSFPSFGKQNTNENPFKSFGQSQQPTQSTPDTSFSFGQNSQQNGDKPASTPFTFGQTNTQAQAAAGSSIFTSASQIAQTPKPTSNIFSSFGQSNGNKPATSQIEQTPKPAISNIFANSSTVGNGLFGSTPPPPESGSQAPKLGESIFSSLNKKDGIAPNMFTSSRDSTPKPTDNIFAAATQPNTQDAAQTPKPSNIFGSIGQSQANGVKQNMFAGSSTSQAVAETPKATSNVFGGAFNQQKPDTSSKPMFNFGQPQQQDTSMTTPGNTPQKQIDTGAQQPASAVAPATKSLFDRIAPRDDPPATAPRPSFTPSTAFFNAPSTSNSASDSESQKATAPTPTGGLSDRISTPATAVKPSMPTNSFSSTPSAAPWLTHGPSALTKQVSQDSPPPPSTSTSPAKTTASSTAKDLIPATEKFTLKALNEGLKAHLATQDADSDWAPIMQYYIAQAAKARNMAVPTTGLPSVSVSGPSATPAQQKPPQPASSSALFGSATPKAPAPAFATTPKPATAPSFTMPPQTAPVNRKRSAEEGSLQIPATEKRARPDASVEYPRLPENASETARLFQASLDRSKGAAPSFSQPQAAKAAAPEPKQMEAAQNPSTTGFKSATGGFTPSTGGFSPSTSGFKPSIPAGMPSFSGANSFLAAFGKKANEEEEKARKKRKAEDYDSDEETEEQWAARDKAEQEAKRQKIMAAAQSGAGFTPSDVGTPAPESDDEPAGSVQDLDRETTPVQSKSLFERVTPRDPPATAPSKPSFFGSQTPAASKSSSNMFASKTPSGLSTTANASNLFSGFSKPHDSIEVPETDKTEAEREQGAGDNTWKPNTPIKFGGSGSTATESTTPAAPPPAFGNLFGGLAPKANIDSTGHLNVPNKASFGFSFGGQPSSLTNSRATTPGVTTDGEGASTAGEGDDDEDSAAASQAEPQVEDQTGLRDSEKEHEEVLFSVAMAKGMKWDEKKNDAGEIVMGWADRGKGPLYILKHRDTGKVRVVLKVPPYGVTKMNFAPLKDINYELVGKGGKMVQGVFVDHLDGGSGAAAANTGRKLSKWMLQVGKKEDAEQIAKILMAERA